MAKRIAYYTFIPLFIWAGLVAGISFLEAWVKFTAPSLSLPVGLDVGRHVFAAMNKTELALAFFVTAGIAMNKSRSSTKLLLAVLLGIVFTQTLYLLPKLDARALHIISGMPGSPTWLHTAYIVSDAVKLVLLFSIGLSVISRLKEHERHIGARKNGRRRSSEMMAEEA